MYRPTRPTIRLTSFRRQLIWALLTAMVIAPALADDRSLLRNASGEPYVFVVLDTSGSMHWSTPCSEEDAANDIDPWDNKCTSVCPLSDAKCAQMCPDVGCIEYDQDASATTAIEVIVDNSDTTKVTTVGNWYSWTAEAYGADYLYTPSGSAAASITYRTSLPESGEYLLYAYWSARTYRVEDARLTIEHADGTNYLEVDQGDLATHAQFNYLGKYNFDSAQDAVVTLSSFETGGGSLAADAIRFYRLPEPASPVCLQTGYRCQQDLCPRGDCPLPLGADDPYSKFFQAREAMYKVIEQVPNVHFGFSTYDLTNMRLRYKHYLYRVADTKTNGTPQNKFSDNATAAAELDDLDWPAVGIREVFGTGPLENTGGHQGGYTEWGRGEGGNNPFNVNDNSYAVFDCARRGAAEPGNFGFDDDVYIGCIAGYPADYLDPWEMDRFKRIPKLGQDGQRQTWVFIRDTDNQVYRIDYEYGSGDLGDDTLVVEMDLHKCLSGDCRDGSERQLLVNNMEVTYELVSDFAEYQGSGTYRYPNMRSRGFFGRSSAILAQEGFNDPVLGNVDLTCTGLEQNNDWQASIAPYNAHVDNNHDDAWWDYAITWPWVQDSRGDNDIAENPLTPLPRSDVLDDGDFIALDWEDTHNELLLQKLAPNAYHLDANNDPVATGAEPDFRTAVYFRDTYDASEPSGAQSDQNGRRLRLRDERERPVVAFGRTPLDDSMEDFREWYVGSSDCQAARTAGTLPSTYPCGWRDYALAQDTDFACRQRYVLFLTDGVETCNPVIDAVCEETLDLNNNFGVSTFVVGFGFPDADDSLLCMADNGGTTAPFLPRNKDELVEALTAIFDKVKAQARSFASASIPAVQSTAADKIYLSSFTPVSTASIWPGRVDVFRQPLPLGDDNRPRTDIRCGITEDVDGTPLQSGCHLYDVAERLLLQAPEPEDVDIAGGGTLDFHVSMDEDDRRLIYGQENPFDEWPAPLRLMLPPIGDDADDKVVRADLGWGLLEESFMVDFEAGINDEDDLKAEIDKAVVEVVKKRVENFVDDDGFEVGCTGQLANTPCTYVMGDIFHANPQVVASPDDFAFFRKDLCGAPSPLDELNNCIPATAFTSAEQMRQRGYREYTRRNVWRRRMLATFTNDGQIHFFDSGRYANLDLDNDGDGDQELLTDGTGKELFSYMPRMLMPIVRDQIHGTKHIYSMDGNATVSDVFIDPVQEALGGYEATDREWRTVMIGGVREAGDVFDEPDDVPGFESGYYALDLTVPDSASQPEKGGVVANIYEPYIPDGEGKNFIPDCMAVDPVDEATLEGSTADRCKTLAGEEISFPAEIWSFNDSILVNGSGLGVERFFLDEDQNLVHDLGRTWSKPLVVQIPVCSSHTAGMKCEIDGDVSDVQTRWVAVFGGGLDPKNLSAPEEGNFLYMVDVESGQTIYKRELGGAVPSDPAALDENRDGVIDRIYIGTTEGLLYKVDLRAPSVITSGYPGIEDVQLTEDQLLNWPAAYGTTTVDIPRIADSAWEPYVVADVEVPIYFPPSIFRVPESDYYGLAFGVGDREDLWRTSTDIGKFFVIVDEEFTPLSAGLPVTEAVLEAIDWEGVSPNENLLIRQPDVDPGTGQILGRPGWVMQFEENMRSITEPFILAGIVVFSVFDPDVTPVAGPGGTVVVCARSGDTYAFVVSLENGAALDPSLETDPSFGCKGRCQLISEFTTALHLERSSTKNPSSGGGLGNSRQFDQELANSIREAIMDRMPRTCQFNPSFELVVSALRNTTGVSVYARVPMMVCPGDWRN